jgi:hypothetical protein
MVIQGIKIVGAHRRAPRKRERVTAMGSKINLAKTLRSLYDSFILESYFRFVLFRLPFRLPLDWRTIPRKN